jgi:hypothetical protein
MLPSIAKWETSPSSQLDQHTNSNASFCNTKVWILQLLCKNFCNKLNSLIFETDLTSIGMEFWTSGSNEGESCSAQNVYNWCSQTQLNDSFFAPEFLAKSGNKYFRNYPAQISENDRCVSFKLVNATNSTTEKSGFEHASCNKTLNYICEALFQINIYES